MGIAVAELLDREAVLSWTAAAVRDLSAARAAINEANVFPVADSDTGTNLLLTLSQGARAAREAHVPGAQDVSGETPGAGELTLRAFAHGALLGARGNSGIIVSEYLRGFAKALQRQRKAPQADGSAAVLLAGCLAAAASSAYAAVADPVQGTMLTAADGAARSAGRQAELGGSLEQVVHAACEGARAALARSPHDLAVLAHNGVLDAGAYGLTLLLDGLAEGLLGPQGRTVAGDLPDLVVDPSWDRADALPAGPALTARSGRELDRELDSLAHEHHAVDRAHRSLGADVDGEFEVMFVVELPDTRATGAAQDELAEGLRTRLRAIGKSVVVVGGDGVWQAHVHTDDVPGALATVRRGRMRQICVRHLPGQLAAATRARGTGVVVGTGSPALVADLARTGAVVLLATAQGWRPEEVVRAAVDTDAPDVVVLTPPGCVDAVRAAADLTRVALDVVGVPTDLHAVAALAAEQTADTGPADLGAVLRAAVSRVRHRELDLGPGAPAPEQAASSVVAAVEGLGGLGPHGTVLLLPAADVAPQVLAAVEDALAAEVPGAEPVCLRTGLAGTKVRVGLL